MWIKDLSVRPETVKLLEEYVVGELLDIGLDNFLDLTPKSQGNKSRNKWDCIRLQSFCTAQETTNKMKRQPMAWEKILTNHIYSKGLMFRICKELIHLKSKKTI